MTEQVLISHRYRFDDSKGEPIAHVTLYEKGGVLWLTDLWTHPEYRRQGRAGRLLAAALARFGGEVIYLEVSPYTDQPVELATLAAWYGRFGFEATDVPNVLRRPAAMQRAI